MTTTNDERRSRRFTLRQKVSAVVAVVMLVAAGGAYAYWTGGGSGSGSASVGTNGAVTLTAAVTAGIAPGTAVPVSFTAANATASPIEVTTLHLVSIVADAGPAACATGDFSMADVTEAHQVPANATAEALPTDGSLVYANTGVSQDACKDAVLTLTLSSQ
jgi:hypothetical protein